MAQKGVSVGVAIKGDAKGFKSASKDAQNATEALKRKAASNSREIERKFKMVTIAVAKVAAAFIVAKKGLELYSKIVSSTNVGADKLAINQTKVKFAIDQVTRSIAQSDFSNFGKGIRDAVEAGKDLALQLDLIGDLQLRLMLITSDANLAIVQQELLFRNAANSNEVRVAAAKEYLRLVKELETEQLKFAQQQVKGALMASSVAASGMVEDRLNYYIRNIDLLAENEAAVISYIEAVKNLKSEEQKPSKNVFTKEGFLIEGQNQLKIEAFKKEINSASDVVKDFALDYMNFMSIIEPERIGLTAAWAKLSEVMVTAASAGLKPLRTVAGLLKEANDEVDELIERYSKLESIIKLKPLPILDFIGGPLPNVLRPPTPADNTEALARANENLQMQMNLVNQLEGAFANMFSVIGSGSENAFQEMAAAFISAIRQMAAQMAAKIAIFAIFSALFPESLLFKSMGSIGQFIGVGSAGAAASIPSASTGQFKSNQTTFKPGDLVTILKGKDIHIVYQRALNTSLNNT